MPTIKTMTCTSFIDRLRPAPRSGGLAIEGYWVWCGSPIRGKDGLYHLFASRWPRSLSFSPHWLTNSEVVRAVSDRAEGPYEFQEIVLRRRGEPYWDGRMTHNPTVHRHGHQYLLFYTGTTYAGHTPTAGDPCDAWNDSRVRAAHANQRIGLAIADAVTGPWRRFDQPILEPRPKRWDGLITTNPAVCVRQDGSILLIYKSVEKRGGLMHLGAAVADNPRGPYQRLSDQPILQFDAIQGDVEDPCIWLGQDGGYEMIMKDMTGRIGGEPCGGIHACSDDGVHWEIADPARAYSRTVRWDDGRYTTQDFLERPQMLIQDGRPTHLFMATGIGGPVFEKLQQSWSMAIPLGSG